MAIDKIDRLMPASVSPLTSVSDNARRTVMPEIDRRVGDLASRQHGVVGREQLREIGFSRDAIQARVRRGWLRPVHRGVYAVGHTLLEDRGRWMAAVLAVGQRASGPIDPGSDRPVLLSHRSAAALHGLLPARDHSAVELTTAFSHSPRAGIRSHRSRHVEGAGTWRDGIPCTTVARTLVDIAGTGNAAAFDRSWSAAASLRVLRGDEIERELQSAPYRPGVVVVQAALQKDFGYLTQRTRSDLERSALRLCRDFGLPRPESNRLVRVDGRTFEADLLWPEARLIVEVDGDRAHRSAVARRRDRERDLTLQLAGWRTIRIGEGELIENPARIAERLRTALAQAVLEPALSG